MWVKKKEHTLPESGIEEVFYKLQAESLGYLDHFQTPLHNSQGMHVLGKVENGSFALEERIDLVVYQR